MGFYGIGVQAPQTGLVCRVGALGKFGTHEDFNGNTGFFSNILAEGLDVGETCGVDRQKIKESSHA